VHLVGFIKKKFVTMHGHMKVKLGVIKNYGECCCRVRYNGKAGVFNTGSDASKLSNSV
jgi:hypothetical protein